MSVWVWPPQISISTQGRVTLRAMRSNSSRAIRGSRNSSRYFIEQLENPPRFFGIHLADGKPHVDQHVIAQGGFRDEVQVRLAGNAAELDVTDSALTPIFDAHDLTGNSEAHIGLLNPIIPQCWNFR